MKFPGEQALDHPIDSSAHHAEVSMNSDPIYCTPATLVSRLSIALYKRVSGEYDVDAWDIAHVEFYLLTGASVNWMCAE